MAKRRLKKPSPTPFLRWNKRSRRGVPAKSETNHRNANRSSVRKGLLSVHDGGPFCLAVILRLRGYWVDIVCEVNLGGYAKFHLIRFSAFRGKAENHLPLIGEGLLPAGMAAGFSSAGCVRFVRREGKGNGTSLPLSRGRWRKRFSAKIAFAGCGRSFPARRGTDEAAFRAFAQKTTERLTEPLFYGIIVAG